MEGIDVKEAKHPLVPMIISDNHNVHTHWVATDGLGYYLSYPLHQKNGSAKFIWCLMAS